MHFWQLKTFWRECKVCEDDIEIHSFQEISTDPPIALSSLDKFDPLVKRVVDEMIKFKDFFMNSMRNDFDNNDLTSFWLRKTKKPVLSVLLTRKDASSEYEIFRGSIPHPGSLIFIK